MASNPTPTPTPSLPVDPPFLPKQEARFADNEFQNITEKSFRDAFGDVDKTFVKLTDLNTNLVRGATFETDFIVLVNGLPTINTAVIPPRYRILGMEAVALNGTDAATAAAGVRADPIYFKLLPYAGGDVAALVNAKPTTITRLQTRWVRISGTDEEKVASYLDLPLEDARLYKGEVYKYTFTDLTPAITRLFEVRADMNLTQNPLPTGLDSDPYYRPFAPLAVASAGVSQAYVDEADTSLYNYINTLKKGAAVEVGGVPTLFSTYELAEAAAAVGATVLLSGYHAAITVDKTLKIIGSATVKDVVVGFGSTNIDFEISQITVLGRLVICPVNGNLSGYIHDLPTGSEAFLESYGIGTGSYTATVVVERAIFNNIEPYSGNNAANLIGSGVVRYQERQSRTIFNFKDSILTSKYGATFSGYTCNEVGFSTSVILSGSTSLNFTTGKTRQETNVINSGINTADADFFVDNRIAVIVPITATALTAGTIPLDFSKNPRQTVDATAAVNFTTVNREKGSEKTLYIKNTTGAPIALTYEAWVCFPSLPPATLAAGKELILVLTCLGTSASDVKVAAVISN